MHMVSTRTFHSRLLGAIAILASVPLHAGLPTGYPGTAYQGKVQEIPGRVFLSDFDQGPKDVTWHDFDTKNPWACKVRDSTGVGLQLMGQGGDKGDTKEADSLVRIRMGKCYLAQTNKNDWTKYTVNVKQAGAYKLAFLSAAAETLIPFVAVSLLTDKDSAGTGQITLPITTYFHHWVYTRDLAKLNLDVGTQVLRFDVPGNGPMNIDYIDFEYTGAATVSGPGRTHAPADGLIAGPLARGSDGALSLDFNAPGNDPVAIRVFDAAGFLLASETASARAGANRFSFRGAASPAGLVFLELRQGGNTARSRSVLTEP